MQPKAHWENVYAAKPVDGVSWFQEHAKLSLQFIIQTGIPKAGAIIDVGGGASTLVDDLLDNGYSNITVLDLSAAALQAAQKRIGQQASQVKWTEADITTVELPDQAYDVWHDRAVFHFLTSEAGRKVYIDKVLKAVKPGGHIIVATFAEDGPTQCSGLPVMRYSADQLHGEFGPSFILKVQQKEEHHTPFGTVQKFIYCYFIKPD